MENVQASTTTVTSSVAGNSSQVNERLTTYSLSVILPAHNEEAVIATTIQNVSTKLNEWVPDFEIIVVNDGSKDATREIVEACASSR